MSAADKLVETINSAIEKAGGQTARVWPDMVSAYALDAWVWLISAALLGVGFGWLASYLISRGLRYEGLGDDGVGILILGCVSVLCALVFLLVSLNNISPAVYPEAQLIQSILRK